MSVKLCVAFLLSLLVCAFAPSPGALAASPAEAAGNPDAADALVRRAAELVGARNHAQALPLLDEAIARYERAYRRPGVLVYSARSGPENLAYALAGHEKNIPIHVYGAEWGLAYFLRGFALIDLDRVPEAKAAYDAAIALSPRNSQYLSERAHIHAIERDWPGSLRAFDEALRAVELTPAPLYIQEQTRALRGMAFAQVELGNLDAAKTLHARVLRIDPANPMSMNELRYIRNLESKRR
jgi:tetratricopeptide (TPR) repeat protein